MAKNTFDRGDGLGSLAAEEAAMRRGKGRMLAAMWGAVVIVVVGLGWVLLSGDDARVYRELGKQINGLERAHFQRFWACALEGYKLSNLKSNEDLVAQLDRRGVQGGRRYAQHVRDKCLDTLREMHPELDALMPPQDLNEPFRELDKAVGALRSAWSAYIAHLDVESLEYDSDEARPLLMEVARGWYDFRRAHSEINRIVKANLD